MSDTDKYWDKFIATGKIESYLKYRESVNTLASKKVGSEAVGDCRNPRDNHQGS